MLIRIQAQPERDHVWILFTDQIKAWMPGWDVR
nr:MAG TPA: hypothetical protein [Caudoviricetes sp.]